MMDSRFNWLLYPHHQQILRLLAQEGGEARFVGSAVRDSLLGRKIKDFDVATTHPPTQVERLLQAASISVLPTGRVYGTVTALFPLCAYQITTLRQDLKTYGRHVEVAFTTNWELDAARRDFTMNALYVDANGTLFDFYQGQADLEAGYIRFIGNPIQRIEEDYLRILRFFRFTAFYGSGHFQEEGLKACCALKENIRLLSRERITYEFLRLLEAPNPWPVLRLMAEKDFLSCVSGLSSGLLRVVSLQEECIAMEALEALGVQASRIVRLKSLFRECIECPPHFRLKRQEQKIWGMLSHKEDLFLEYSRKMAAGLFSFEEGKALFQEALLKQQKEEETPFPLTGEDILQLGVAPGKEVGERLKRVREWWKSQDSLPNREACLRYLASLYLGEL